MRGLWIFVLLLVIAIGGPFLWAWRAEKAPKPSEGVANQSEDGSPRTPGVPPKAAEIDDVEPQTASNSLIQALQQMMDDSPVFDEHGDDLREQLSQADQLLTRIKQENRAAIEKQRQDAQIRRPRSASNAKRPHIILFDLGSLSADELSCYDPSAAKTPLFDLLASQGIRFDAHYHTQLDPLQQRQAMLSGGSDQELSSAGLVLNLKKAGYATALIGECQLPGGDPRSLGFDSWFGATKPTAGDGQSIALEANGARIEIGEENPEKVDAQMIYVSEAVSFARRQNPNEPFFAWIAFPTPTNPRDAESPEEIKVHRRTQIKRLQVELAEIIAELNRRGIAKNSVFLLTSLKARTSRSESTYSESELRAPLIVLGPNRLRQNSVVDTPTCAEDLWATIAELTRSKCDSNQSHSLHSFLRKGNRPAAQDGRQYVAWRDEDRTIVRFKQWRYERGDDRESRLIDLTQNKADRVDVSGLHPQIVARGKAFVDRAKKSASITN